MKYLLVIIIQGHSMGLPVPNKDACLKMEKQIREHEPQTYAICKPNN